MKKMLALSFVLALFVTFTQADDKKAAKGSKEKEEKWCEVPAEGQHSVILDSKGTGLQPTKIDGKKSKSVKESKSCETDLEESSSKGCCGSEAKTSKKDMKKDTGKPKS